MSLKISDMTDATGIAEADVFPALESGANVKVTREVFLTALAGEEVRITNNSGSMLRAGPGTAFTLELASGDGFQISIDGGFPNFTVDANGAVTLFVPDGAEFVINSDAGLFGTNVFVIDAAGDVTIQPVSGQVINLTVSLSGGNWTAPTPTDLNDALNRLATAVAGLLGGTIP